MPKPFELCMMRVDKERVQWGRLGLLLRLALWLVPSHPPLPQPLSEALCGTCSCSGFGGEVFISGGWKRKKQSVRWGQCQALCGTFPILKERKEEQAALSAPVARPCLRAATWLCSVIWIKKLELKENRATYESPESLLFLKICPYFYNSSNLINEASSLVWVIQGDSLGSSSFEAILISQAIHCLHLLCFIWFGFHSSSQFYII